MKRLFTLNRVFVYILTFIMILGLIYTLTDFWKHLDFEYYKSVYLNERPQESDQLKDDIRIVNLEKEGTNTIEYRKKVVQFVNFLNADQEKNEKQDIYAVIFDIAFPKEVDTLQLYHLKKALSNLKSKGIKIYAAYSLKNIFDGEYKMSFEENDFAQASTLYDDVFDGKRLHTGFKIENNVITYESVIEVNSTFNSKKRINSLVTEVAKDKQGKALENLDPLFFEKFVAPFDPDRHEIESQTHTFNTSKQDTNESRLTPSLSTIKNVDTPLFILVGDVTGDILKDTDIPGTYALAWALNEQLLGKNSLAKQPLNYPMIIIGQTLFFAFFTILIFALLFKYVKRLQTKPKLLAVLSSLFGTAMLFLYGAVILAMDFVIPIGLTLVAIGVASILAWRFAYKFLVTGIAEGAQKYDVFISYSHGNKDWVKKNVLEPLEAYRKQNGDKLNIFFDEKSIGIGEAFTTKYMWAIVDSKFFIPIISNEYYGKNHCRNEMDLAYKRSVEKLLYMLPIAFSYDAVPPIYNHMNFSDITVDPNFIKKIEEELLKKDPIK